MSINWGLLRWVGWAVIWSFGHPEIYSKDDWLKQPSVVIGSIALYFVLGLFLEFAYRKLVSHWITQRNAYPAAMQPESPEYPWISLLDQFPPGNSVFEVLCADGKIRTANSVPHLCGKSGMEIEYEGEIEKLQRENPWSFRPTQWRPYRKKTL